MTVSRQPAGSEGSSVPTNGGSDHGDKSHHHHHGSATLPATLHGTVSQSSIGPHGKVVTGATPHGHQHHSAGKFVSDEGSECSSVTSDSIGR